jgi:hypothetical protein
MTFANKYDHTFDSQVEISTNLKINLFFEPCLGKSSLPKKLANLYRFPLDRFGNLKRR